MKLKKGTLLFLLLTCLAYTALAQTDYTLQGSDVTIDENGFITACSYDFNANKATGGTNLTILKSVTKDSEIIIKGIGYTFLGGIFRDKNLVSVEFDSDSEVTTIRQNAFEDNQITELTLPTSLTTIGNQAFQNNLITTLTLPASLTTIGGSAFYKNQITKLALPTALTTIGDYAFASNQITELTFPEDSKLTSIGTSAFIINPQLESFTLPSITKAGFRTYWKDGNSVDLKANLTIRKEDFEKSFELAFIEQVTLTVEVNNEEGGSIEPPDDRFVIDKADAPSTQKLTAKPNDGWRFDKWVISDEEDKTDETTTITLDANKTATAHFVQLVTLTTSVEGQQGGTISATPNHSLEDNQYDIDTEVELTATPDEGWRFDKWVISDEEDKNDNPTIVTVDADKTATAHFVKQFTLTTAVAEQQGGTIAPLIDPNGKIYDINTKVELTATPNEGWKFDKWVISDEENKTDKTTTITLDKNKTATAHFVEAVILTLTIVETEASGEVNGLNAGKNKIDKGADFKLKATPASGQKFVSWTIGVETIVTEEYTLPATDTETDISITVTFEAIQVTLTLAIEGQQGGTISATPKPSLEDNQYDIDTEVELTATPDEGWKFDKWVISDEENKTDKTTTITLDQDKTATAHFVQLVTLTTSVEGQQGGTISTTPKPSLEDNQYDIDTEVELTATPDEGWKFDKWVIGTDEITENPTTITLNQDKTATAHFVEEEEEEAITSILTEVVSANPYPNPVTSQITLKAKDGDLIQLFSPKGKQQYSTQHTGNEVHTIDVSTMPVGVYLVRITDAEGNTTTKRILKK